MGYRSQRILGAAALLLIVFTVSASAEMRGNTFVSQQHRASFTRPDGSWDIREKPARENGVALFSNGGGSVIALLLHQAIQPRDVISSVDDLTKRWPALSSKFVGMANAGESGFTISDSRYEVRDNGVEFEIRYSSTLPGNNTGLTNWLKGLIVRDTDGVQHIYAIRCAAPDGVFGAWESQFQSIMPTLTYDGGRGTQLYTSAPISSWWYGGGGLAIIVALIMFLRRGSGRDDESVRPRRPASAQSVNDTVPPQSAAAASMPPLTPARLSESGMTPVAASSDGSAEMMNVPDSYYYQKAQGEAQPHPDVAPGGEASTGGFWKCPCGRVNPIDESFCWRCNADRPATT